MLRVLYTLLNENWTYKESPRIWVKHNDLQGSKTQSNKNEVFNVNFSR